MAEIRPSTLMSFCGRDCVYLVRGYDMRDNANWGKCTAFSQTLSPAVGKRGEMFVRCTRCKAAFPDTMSVTSAPAPLPPPLVVVKRAPLPPPRPVVHVPAPVVPEEEEEESMPITVAPIKIEGFDGK